MQHPHQTQFWPIKKRTTSISTGFDSIWQQRYRLRRYQLPPRFDALHRFAVRDEERHVLSVSYGSQCECNAEHGSNPDVHMLFDNAPSHRNLDDSLYSHTLPMRRTPKYSPMLNPIECAFSSWKAELKNLSANQDIFINPDGQGRGEATLSAFRFNQLKALIDESSRTITADKCVA